MSRTILRGTRTGRITNLDFWRVTAIDSLHHSLRRNEALCHHHKSFVGGRLPSLQDCPAYEEQDCHALRTDGIPAKMALKWKKKIEKSIHLCTSIAIAI